MEKSVSNYQNGKSEVTDAILAVKVRAEELEKAEEFNTAFYELLEAIDYLERVFEGFAYENSPSNTEK